MTTVTALTSGPLKRAFDDGKSFLQMMEQGLTLDDVVDTVEYTIKRSKVAELAGLARILIALSSATLIELEEVLSSDLKPSHLRCLPSDDLPAAATLIGRFLDTPNLTVQKSREMAKSEPDAPRHARREPVAQADGKCWERIRAAYSELSALLDAFPASHDEVRESMLGVERLITDAVFLLDSSQATS